MGVTIATEVTQQPVDDAADQHEAAAATTQDSQALVAALHATASSSNAAAGAIVFIDGAVEHPEQLLAGIPQTAEIVVIDRSQDGLTQIASYLSGRSSVNSIHILSHGEAGRIYLGSTELTAASVQTGQASILAAIGRSLSDSGDILIYGCDVAQGAGGMELIRGIAQATGADVAASIDGTGGGEAGGDWVLEATSGAIETAALDNPLYAGLLVKTNTGAWSVAGLSASNATDGVTTTVGFTNGGGGTWGTIANGTLPTATVLNGLTAATYDNGALGGASLGFVWNSSNVNDTGTVTITFSRAVTNPVIHFDRLGGVGSNGRSNSSVWTLTSGGSLTELAGVGHFDVNSAAGTIQRTIGVASTGTESDSNTAEGTAAGSVRVNGTFTTITFSVRNAVSGGGSTAGDGLEIAFAIDAPPVATNDTFSTTMAVPATINVRANDSDIRGDALTVTHVAGTAITAGGASVAVTGGAVALNTSGNLVFTPNGTFSGATSFTYTIADANGGTSTATVNGTIVNSAPVIDLNSTGSAADTDRGFNTTFATGSPTAIAIADVDSDVFETGENDVTRLRIVAGGTSLAATDVVTIAGQSFTLAADGSATSVSVGGSSVDISYTASTRTFSITNASGATVRIPQGDLDTLVRGVTYQSLSVTQPPSNRTFSFTVTDGAGITSAAAVATVTFLPPPDAVDDTFTTLHDTPVTIDVRSNDSDPQGDAFSVTHVNGTSISAGGAGVAVTGGVVTLNASGNLVFTPAANYVGSPSFTYTIADASGGSDTATVTGTVTNAAPTIDLNGDPVVSVAVSGGGSFSQPSVSASGDRTSSLSFSHGTNMLPDTTTATVTFTTIDNGFRVLVNGTSIGSNVFAVESGDIQAGQIPLRFSDSAMVSTSWVANTSGLPRVEVRITESGITFWGTRTTTSTALEQLFPQGGTITLPDFVAGINTVDIVNVNGGGPESMSGTVSVTAQSTDYSATFTENGTPVAIADADDAIVDADDTNIESAAITLTNPQAGDRLLVNGSAATMGTIGTISWTRTDSLVTLSGSATKAEYAAVIRSIQFENTSDAPSTTPRLINTIVNDGSIASNTAVTTISIDRAPDPADDAFAGSEDSVISGNVLANDTDQGDTPITSVAVAAGPTNGTLTSFNPATGAFVYTPATNFNGTDTFTYTLTDADGDTGTATVTITVSPVNDAPVNTVPATIGPVVEDGTLAITGIVVGDVDGGTLTTTLTVGSGALNLGATGGAVVSGAGSSAVTLTGTAAQINAALATLSFSPRADYNGAVVFQVSTTDGTLTDTDNRTISVTAVADTINDNVTTNEDVAVTFAPLANDNFESPGRQITAIDGFSIAVGGSVTVTDGSVRLNADGTLTFTPDANVNGLKTFTYTVTSGGVTEMATVNVTVTAINDAPVNTVPGAQVTPEDINLVITGASVGDVDGGMLTTTLTLPAGVGNLTVPTVGGGTITGNGTRIVTISGTATQINAAVASITYAPAADYNGTTSLTIATSDGSVTDTDAVALTVTPIVDITNDAVTTNEDTARTFNVLAGTNGATADTFESGVAAVTSVTQPASGAVSFAANGSITYTPAANFSGTDTFSYTVTSGGVTETATVVVTVTAVNDAPVNTVPGAQMTDEDTSVVFSAAAGDAITISDVDSAITTTLTIANGTLTLGSVSGVTVTGNGSGTVTVSGTPAAVTAALNGLAFAPTADWNGTTTLTVSTSDGAAPAVVSTIGITVSPVVDIAHNGVTTAEDTAIAFNALGNDNFDNPGRVISSVTQPTNGVVAFLANGQVTYTPASNYNGTDSFTYTVTSGGVSETTTVSVTVNPVNDAPTGTAPSARTDADATAPIYDVSGFFGDIDGDALTFSASGLPLGLTIDPATGVISGTIDRHASQGGTGGVHSVSITATDPSGALVTRTFDWTVTNPAPVAADDAFTGTEETQLNGSLLGNDGDADGDALQVSTTPVSGPANGTLLLNANGTFSYLPAANFTGTDSFTYLLIDADGATSTATVTLYVNPVNDSPLNTVPGNQSTTEDAPLVFSATNGNAISVSDVDSAAITTTVSVGHGTLSLGSTAGVTVSGNGTGTVTISGAPAAITAALNGLTYVNAPDYNGPDTLSVVSSDAVATTTANLALTVTPVADIAADAVSVSEDGGITFNVLLGTNGASADTFEGAPVVTGFTQPGNGTVTVAANGAVTYTPNANFTGVDTFTYTVTSGGVTETTAVTVTVAAGNDGPTQVLSPAQNGTEDANVVFSGANGNQIVIGDIDAGAAVTTTLSVPLGTLSATATPGVVITGNGSGSVTLVGSPAAVTAALNGLAYVPVADANGPVVLSVSTTDGVAAPVAGTVAITILAVSDIMSDSGVTSEDTAVVIAVLGNDTFENAGRSVTAVTNGANGTVAINPDGTVTYTPNANFNGTDSFTYTVTSGGVTETASVTVVVNAVNDAPVTAVPPAQATSEDAALTFSAVTGNAITVADVDGAPLTTTISVTNGILNIGTAAGVTITGDGTGTATITGSAAAINAALDGFSFAPTADYHGGAVLTVSTTDGSLASNGTIAISITPVVDIMSDAVNTPEDTAIAITVLGNDTFEGGSATVTAVTQGTNGSVSIGAGGVLTYTPNANFNGVDSFTYTVSSGGVTETTTVTVTVAAVNDAPVIAVPGGQVSNEDTQVVFSGAGGNAITISDSDGDTITVSLSAANGVVTLGGTAGVTAAGNGTANVSITGNAAAITAALEGLRFAPTADYNGPAALSVTTSDGTVTTSNTIGITINPVSDITADVVATSEDTPVTFNVLTGTTGATADTFEGASEAVTSVTQGASGSVSFLADGSLVYTPDTNFNGTDTFTYTVTSGGVTETTTVTVHVGVVNDVPTTTGLSGRYNLDGQSISFDVSGAFADQDGEDLDYTIIGLPPGLVYNAETGVISGTIDNSASQGGAAGLYTVTVTASDGNPGGTVAASFTWSIINPGPTAVNDTATVAEDASVAIDVLVNDTDPDADTQVVDTATASNGSVSIDAFGNIVYTPNADFNGTDTIVYTMRDGEGGYSSATVTVNVTAVNDDPTVTGLSDLVDADSQDVNIDISGAFADLDGDALTFAVTGLPPGLSFNAATGQISGTIAANASAPTGDTGYPITVTADDGNGGSVSTTFTWRVLNVPPTSVDDSVTTPEDTPVVATVLSNDFDPDGDPLTITHINGQAISVGGGAIATPNGRVELTTDAFGNHVLVFTPDADFNGVETLVYTTDDGNSGMDTATLTINVVPANDAPTASALANLTNADSDSVSIDVSSYFQDIDTPDGDTLAFSAIGLPAGITIDSVTGVISGAIATSASANGPYTVAVTATDAAGATVTTSFTWDVINPAPTAGDDSNSLAEGADIAAGDGASVLPNDADPDGDALTVATVNGLAASVGQANAGSSGGLFTVNADGSYTFAQNGDFETLKSGETRTTFVSYTIADGDGGFSTATLLVTITGTNDAPIASSLEDITTVDSAPLTLNAAAAFDDIDNDDLTFSIDPAFPLPSGLSIDPDSGVISGTIDSSASAGGAGGIYTVSVLADDGNGGVTPVTFTITVTNPAPNAGDDSAVTNEDTPVSGSVAGNDSDPDGDVLSYTVAATPANGSVVLDPLTGAYVYTPAAHFNGTDTFTYTVTDADGAIRTQTVTVTVNAVNDAPTSSAIANQASADDSAVSLNVAASFSDVDGTPLVFSVDPANPLPPGLSIDPATGLITGTIDRLASASGPYTVTIVAADPDGANVTSTFTWAVTNPAPIGPTLPAITSTDGATISLPVAAGFSDPDGDALTFALSGDLPAGFVINPGTGVITGTWSNGASAGGPANDGVYSVTVTATDSQGASVSKTFTYTVTNPAPTAANDAFLGTEDTALGGSVAANDQDPDGDAVTFALVSGPAHGTLTFNSNGSFTYTPDANYNAGAGGETFTYSIIDAQGATATAKVTLMIAAVNDVPGPAASAITTPEDTPISGTLPATDGDGDIVTFTLNAAPSHGSVIVNLDGTYTYTPAADYVGADSFVVALSDGNGGTVLQTVTVAVTPINDPPVATDDTVPVTEDTPATGNVLGNDADVDGNPLTVTQFVIGGVTYPAGTTATLPEGTLVIGTNGSFTFTPAPNYNGPVPVATYTVSDGQGGTDTGTLALGPVSPVNDAPVATDDTMPVIEDTPATGNVLGNDTDVDDNPLTVTQFVIGGVTYPAGTTATLPEGTLVIGTNGSFTFTPAANYNGPVPVATYTVSDGQGGTDTGTLTLGPVSPVNDAPVATNDTMPVIEDTPATGNVLGNDTDVDGNPLTVTQFVIGGVTYPAGTTATLPEGTLLIGANGSFTFTPAPNYNGPVPVATYTVSDGQGGTDTSTLTLGPVSPVNDPPVATDDTIPVIEDTPVTGNVLGNDTDVDGNPLTVTQFVIGGVTYPAGTTATLPEGTLVIGANGSFTFTPAANYNGPVPVATYTVSDGQGGTDTGTLTLGPVSPVNDAPVATDDTASVLEATEVVIDVLGNDRDIDGDTLVISAASSPDGTVTITPDGRIAFTPNPGFLGVARISYTISDGNGGLSSASVAVNVGPKPVTPLQEGPKAPTATPQIASPSITVEGAVLDAVETIEGGGSGGTGLAVEGIVITTVNRFSGLRGTGTIGQQDGTIRGEITRIDRLRELDDAVSTYRGVNSYDVQGLTGFSLRFAFAQEAGWSAAGGQLILETLVREHYLIVQISNTFALNGKSVAEYRVMQADGRPIPDWLDNSGTGTLIGRHPVDIEAIRLRVVAVMTDGTTVTRDVEIQTMSGEIQPLDIGRKSEIPLPQRFSEQLRTQAMLSSREISTLASALTAP